MAGSNNSCGAMTPPTSFGVATSATAGAGVAGAGVAGVGEDF